MREAAADTAGAVRGFFFPILIVRETQKVEPPAQKGGRG